MTGPERTVPDLPYPAEVWIIPTVIGPVELTVTRHPATRHSPGLETVLVQAEGIYTTALRVAEPPTEPEGTEESQ